MKKSIVALAVATIFTTFSTGVYADDHSRDGKDDDCKVSQKATGGFINSDQKVITVAEAKKLSDDSFVIVQGTIEKKIDKNTYLFKDATGTIDLEVRRKVWNGAVISPKDEVKIMGEIDSHFNSVELDAKHITKVEATKTQVAQ